MSSFFFRIGAVTTGETTGGTKDIFASDSLIVVVVDNGVAFVTKVTGIGCWMDWLRAISTGDAGRDPTILVAIWLVGESVST